jgi:hypothetical protein
METQLETMSKTLVPQIDTKLLFYKTPKATNNKSKSTKGKLLGVIINGDSHYAIAHRLIDWTMKLG